MATATAPAPAKPRHAKPKVGEQKMLIGGKWVSSVSGKTFATLNPTSGEVICNVAEGDKADIDLAVKAAREAFERGPWSRMSAAERGLLTPANSPTPSRSTRTNSPRSNRSTTASRSAIHSPPTCRCPSRATATTPAGPTRSRARRSPSTGTYFCYTRHEPIGVVGPDHPVELPAAHAGVEVGPGAGLRQHGRAQARRADAAHGPARRATRAGSRLPRRRHQRRARLRPDRRRGTLIGTWTWTRSPSPAKRRPARS